MIPGPLAAPGAPPGALEAPAAPPWGERTPLRESPGVAAFLGWVVPGLGHLWLGRPGKALYYFLVLGAAWGVGLWLCGGAGISYERHPVWLAAQAWLAGPTLAAAWATRDLEVVRRLPFFEVGQLYLSVASLLNLVAVADALGIADGLATARRRARVEQPWLLFPPTSTPPSPTAVATTVGVAGHPPTAAQDEWPPPAALDPSPAVAPPPARPSADPGDGVA